MKTKLLLSVSLACALVGCGASESVKRPRIKAESRVQEAQKPVKREEPFAPRCESPLAGCEQVGALRAKEEQRRLKLAARREEFQIAFAELIALLQTELAPPQVSLSHTFSPEPAAWTSTEMKAAVSATVKLKYGTLADHMGAERAERLMSALRTIGELNKKWREVTEEAEPLSISLPTAQGKLKEESISVPKGALDLSPLKSPASAKLYVGLVSAKHDLPYFIHQEHVLPLRGLFTLSEDLRSLKIEQLDALETQSVSFETPVAEVCDQLRVEARLERGAPLRRVMKPKPAAGAAQEEAQEAARAARETRAKNRPLGAAVVQVLHAINPSAAPRVSKSGQWRFPPVSDEVRQERLSALFKRLPLQPSTDPQRVCLRANGKKLYSFSTSAASLSAVLEALDVDPALLVPEESLSFDYSYLDKRVTGFAEPADLGDELFAALSKRSEAVLKLNKRLQEIPYMLSLSTDTGSQIRLPVEVDGLKSKRLLAEGSMWRLVGASQSFPILEETLHDRLLAEMAHAGLVQLSQIKHKREYRDVTTPWVEADGYDVLVVGEGAATLGRVSVLVESSVWVHVEPDCPLVVDFLSRVSQKGDGALVRRELVKGASYQPPGLEYVTGYADPPNCR